MTATEVLQSARLEEMSVTELITLSMEAMKMAIAKAERHERDAAAAAAHSQSSLWLSSGPLSA